MREAPWTDHDLQTVRRVLQLLADAGIRCWLFGGWAEELRRLCPARPHNDVDLLYAADGFHRRRRATPSARPSGNRGQAFPHKRAFVFESVIVELFLVQHDADGAFTSFWGRKRHDWPADTLSRISDVPVASAAALVDHRDQDDALAMARSTEHRPGGAFQSSE